MSEDRQTSDTEGSDSSSGGGDDGAATDRRAGWLEIVATGVSSLLLAAMLGVLIRDAAHPNTSPEFAVRPGPVAVTGASYRVSVTVHNSGDDAAKGVMVHLELVASDSTMAQSDLTIDWLPGNTSKEVVGLFTRPASAPSPTGVRAEVRGYATP